MSQFHGWSPQCEGVRQVSSIPAGKAWPSGFRGLCQWDQFQLMMILFNRVKRKFQCKLKMHYLFMHGYIHHCPCHCTFLRTICWFPEIITMFLTKRLHVHLKYDLNPGLIEEEFMRFWIQLCFSFDWIFVSRLWNNKQNTKILHFQAYSKILSLFCQKKLFLYQKSLIISSNKLP